MVFKCKDHKHHVTFYIFFRIFENNVQFTDPINIFEPEILFNKLQVIRMWYLFHFPLLNINYCSKHVYLILGLYGTKVW